LHQSGIVHRMTGRFIAAVVTTICEEAIIAGVVMWGLPRLDIHLPLGVLIAIMAVWAVNSIIFYRIGSQALRRRPVSGLGSVVNDTGKVVKPLTPDGVIKIKGELWEAKSAGGHIEVGEVVMVVEQDGLKVTVIRAANSSDRNPPVINNI
jgi:membrane-bound ClpP family serine protease